MNKMHSDSAIIEALAARKEEGIEWATASYGRLIRQIAFGILRHEEDAREVENDVYQKLWKQTESEEVTDLKAFVSTLSRRLAIDRLRANAARKRSQPGYGEALEELAEVLPDPGASDPADALALQNALDSFLRSLPLKQRQIFLCRYWYGMSVKECQQAFGMGASGIKSSLMRSREALRACLKREEIGL